MARNPKIQIEIDAKDDASDKLEDVADKVDKLDGERATVEADAEDNATDELADIRDKLDRLDGDEAKILLKAEAKDARADLRAAQKELIDLDGKEGEVEVKADIADAKSRLGAIDNELDDLDGKVVEPKIEAPDAQGSGRSAGDLFGLGAIKGLGAAGIAVAIKEVFELGIERAQLRSKMQAKFGKVESDAKVSAKLAGEVYSDGWGESLEEVNAAFGTVDQAMSDTSYSSQAEMQEITTSALAIADVFGVDMAEVIRAADLLVSNGLAPTMEDAFDVIVTGFQEGDNRAGDLLETINEYSKDAGALGLTHEDFFKILHNGMQNGQRDTDKLGDAIKELNIRVLEGSEEASGALEDLGLNADETRAAFAEGGPAASGSFLAS